MNAPLLQVRDLEKTFRIKTGTGGLRSRYGTLRAVDRISFDLGRGESLGVVGESGCGKTTTAMMLLGLEHPSAGEIRFDGALLSEHDRGERRQFRRRVQAVLQDPWSSMSPKMRIHEFLSEPMIAEGRLSRAERDARLREVMQLVGLRPEQAGRYPHEFSGGQRQRLCIARALTVEPNLIVLDEPVSALDVSVQAQIMNLLKDVQRRTGVSYVMISHSLATVRYLCSHVAVMYLGQLVEFGPAREVIGAPRHPYTAALVAASDPMTPIGETAALDGEVPSPANPPPGCRFHTRCPTAIGLCSAEEPQLTETGQGVRASCHLVGTAMAGTA